MSEVHTNNKLRFHESDALHYSNWCKKCGLYYCWHDEAKEFDVHKNYQHDARAKGHKFEPQDTEGHIGDGKIAIQEEELI